VSGDWSVVTLDDVLTEDRDRVEVQPDAEYPIAGVYGFGRGVLLRGSVRGSEISAKHLYRTSSGQIMYSRLKAFEGAFALVPSVADGRFVSNEFPTFTVDTERALPEFIALVLARPPAWEQLTKRITGVGARRERLQVPDFLDFELALPSLDEQERIVAATRRVEAAAAAAEHERALSFAALQAGIDALIVPGGTWDALPASWSLSTLGEVADVRSGITKGRKTKEKLTERPFLRAANVQNGYLDLAEIKPIEVSDKEIERFRLQEGDVLMVEGSGSRDRLGRGWIWEGQIEDCLHQNHVFRARPDAEQVLPRFLAYLLDTSAARGHFLEAAKTTSGLVTINRTQTAALPVPLPPLAQQAEIVRRLDVLRAAGVAAKRSHSRLERLRAVLIEDLVSGACETPELPDEGDGAAAAVAA